MSYKTILVHCDANPRLSQRLDVAVDLAQRYAAHLVGAHMQAPMDIPAFSGGVMPMPMYDFFAAYEASAKAEHDTAAAAFTKAIKGTHLPSEWRVAKGYPEERACHSGSLRRPACGRPDRSRGRVAYADGPPRDRWRFRPGARRWSSRIIGVRSKPGKSVMLCWNASRESARAAAEALPFLVAADKVVVLIVDPKTSVAGHGAEPGADVASWLARHGVNVTVLRDVAADTDVGSVILSRAADHDIDLIVMGIYGHSRLREVILGGASRTLLSRMTVPVLMAH